MEWRKSVSIFPCMVKQKGAQTGTGCHTAQWEVHNRASYTVVSPHGRIRVPGEMYHTSLVEFKAKAESLELISLGSSTKRSTSTDYMQLGQMVERAGYANNLLTSLSFMIVGIPVILKGSPRNVLSIAFHLANN